MFVTGEVIFNFLHSHQFMRALKETHKNMFHTFLKLLLHINIFFHYSFRNKLKSLASNNKGSTKF